MFLHGGGDQCTVTISWQKDEWEIGLEAPAISAIFLLFKFLNSLILNFFGLLNFEIRRF